MVGIIAETSANNLSQRCSAFDGSVTGYGCATNLTDTALWVMPETEPSSSRYSTHSHSIGRVISLSIFLECSGIVRKQIRFILSPASVFPAEKAFSALALEAEKSQTYHFLFSTEIHVQR